MLLKSTSNDLQDCFTKAIPNITVANKMFIIETLKICYDGLDITFTDCDNNCIIEHIASHSTASSSRESDGYDPAKLEDFYNTIAKENIELCHYNCHHLDKTEI